MLNIKHSRNVPKNIFSQHSMPCSNSVRQHIKVLLIT
jgi:hypothetical protein